jgi:TRAP-type C4-dicarboxylate transport system permease small subunit
MAGPLNNLSKSSPRKDDVEKKGPKWVNLLVWFLVSAILAYVILYSWNPVMLQTKDVAGKATGVSDMTKTVIASIVVGLVVALVVYFVQRK